MIISDATRKYLEPLDQQRIGDAQLVVDYRETKEHRHFTIDLVECNSQGELTTPRSLSACRFVERKFQHGWKRINRQNIYWPSYDVPVTDYSVLLLQHAWPRKQLTLYRNATQDEVKRGVEGARTTDDLISYVAPNLSFASSLAQQKFDELANRDNVACQCAIRTARYRSDGTTDSHPFLDLPSKHNPKLPTLHPYQKVAATNAINSKAYALFMAPGTGKTPVAIAKSDYVSCQIHSSSNRPARILILAPKNVRQNWIREYSKFSRVRHVCHILQGSNEIERNYRLAASLLDDSVHSQVVVSGYDAAVATPLIKAVEWDLIVVDESHNVANPSTQRTKFLLSLRNSSQHRLILTGTPVRNTPFDLYSQLEFLGEGLSGFESFTAFKNFFGVWRTVPGKGIRVLQELNNIPLLQERLAKYAFVISKEEALPHLPKKYYDTLNCTLSKQQFDVYKQVAEDLQGRIDDIDIADAVSVNNILTQMLRLAQITSGYAVTDESGLYRFDPNPKLEMLIEAIKDHLEESPDSKIQIWCAFKENVKQLAYRLNNIEAISTVTFTGDTSDDVRLDAEYKFNCDPSTKVFIGTARAGGVGLNLVGFDSNNPDAYSTNCDWVVYFSKNWSSTDYVQSQDRAHRANTRVQVRVTSLEVAGSIDEEISARVDSKIEMATSLQDIRLIAANLLKNVQVNGD